MWHGWQIGMVAYLALVLTGPAMVPAVAEEFSFTTLEWQPFSGSMPEQGSMAAVLRAAYAGSNDGIRVTVMPWKRAVAAAMQDDGPHVGFFTATARECEQAGGIISTIPIGQFRLGLAHRRDNPLTWKEPNDLRRLHIGVVDGYDNGPLIENMRALGFLRVDVAASDDANLRKVQAGRIDAAVVEMSQFAYLAPRLTGGGAFGLAPLTLHPTPLGPPGQLHACFNRGKRASIALARLNEGLSRIDTSAIAADYLRRHTPQVAALQ